MPHAEDRARELAECLVRSDWRGSNCSVPSLVAANPPANEDQEASVLVAQASGQDVAVPVVVFAEPFREALSQAAAQAVVALPLRDPLPQAAAQAVVVLPLRDPLPEPLA